MIDKYEKIEENNSIPNIEKDCPAGFSNPSWDDDCHDD